MALFNTTKPAPSLAKGPTYTYSPPALYELTQDDGDHVQLTDGKYAPDPLWTSGQAVGWLSGAAPIEIAIDLGQVKRLGKVGLHTARRADAGVSFPRRVDIFISEDDEHFAWMGDLMAGQDAGAGPYHATTFASPELRREARYLRLLIAPSGPYFFADEVEVDSAEGAAAQVSDRPPAPLTKDELKAFALEHEAVSQMASALFAREHSAQTPLARRLNQVLTGLDDRSGGLDLEKLAAAVNDMRQAIQADRAQVGHLIEVQWTNPWQQATPFDFAPLDTAIHDLDIPQGGHGAFAVAVAHSSPYTQQVHVSAEVLGAPNNAIQLSLFEVGMITRADGKRHGDPLLPLRQGTVAIPAGESRQVWGDLKAGPHLNGPLTLRLHLESRMAGKLLRRSLDMPLRIWPVHAVPPPTTVAWGYLNSPPIRHVPRFAAQDMLAHGINTAVLPAADLPWPAAGSLDQAIGDYQRFDKVMATLQGHRQYLFFLSFNSDSFRRSFGGRYPFLSDPWKSLFRAWIREWSARLQKSGIGYEAFALYPVDEPDLGAEHDALVAVARLIKETDPQIRVYTTLHQPEVLSPALLNLVDCFQLNGAALKPDIISKIKRENKEVLSYATTGGGKSGDPATFYRAQGWEAFALGLSGFGFWSYADIGHSGTAWNDTDDVRPDYAVIYEGRAGVYSSKRWEAWREGYQDYQILSSAWARARTKSDQLAIKGLVLAGWRSLGDYNTFGSIRRRLLEWSVTTPSASASSP